MKSILVCAMMQMFSIPVFAETIKVQEVESALGQGKDGARIAAITALARRSDGISQAAVEKTTRLMLQALTKKPSQEVVEAVLDFGAQKLNLQPVDLLIASENSQEVLRLLLRSADKTQLPRILNKALEGKRPKEKEYEMRILESLDTVDNLRRELQGSSNPSSADEARRSVLESNLVNLALFHSDQSARRHAAGLVAARNAPLSLSAWKNLLSLYPVVGLDQTKGKVQQEILKSNMSNLVGDPRSALAIMKELVALVGKNPSATDMVTSLLENIPLRSPAAYRGLESGDLADFERQIEQLLQSKAAGDLRVAIEAARLIGPQSSFTQAALFNLANGPRVSPEIKRAANSALDVMDRERVLSFEPADELIRLSQERSLGYEPASDPRLVRAQQTGPMRVTSALLSSIDNASTAGLHDLTEEHVKRGTRDPKFLAALRNRVLSPSFSPEEREYLDARVVPLVRRLEAPAAVNLESLTPDQASPAGSGVGSECDYPKLRSRRRIIPKKNP